ncbi:MAG: phosphoglycerate kinase [Chloroflexota bacterium]|nr:phosphoglycerate kinase [Chloroflexota bacterium]
MTIYQSIKDIPVSGKRVIVRVDYNVPFDKITGNISDDSRMQLTLPSLRYLINQNAKIVLISHRGRPSGKSESLSLKPIGDHLSSLLGISVEVLEDCIGDEVIKKTQSMDPGEIVLLENLRFYKEEEDNDQAFAVSLSQLGDYYVNEAFSVSHRAHASTESLPQLIPAVAGFLLEKEMFELGRILKSPSKPLSIVMGGAKVSDKMNLMKKLVPLSENILVGGGMAAAFLSASGHNIGISMIESNGKTLATEIIAIAKSNQTNLLVPEDVVISNNAGNAESFRTTEANSIPEDQMIVDIGPKTISNFSKVLKTSNTILWNGPMGIFEIHEFSNGTKKISQTIVEQANKGGIILLGGGSTAEAAKKFDILDKVTHVSTGGGASLQFLEGKDMPGITHLMINSR